MMKTTGAFMTTPTQRAPIERDALSSWLMAAKARRSAREPALGARRRLARPMMAGSRVMAIETATKTANALAIPMVERNGMPTTKSPSRAMITVMPANTTAPPAVATDCAADSSGSIPAASWFR